jgi:hypothetical protein
MMFVQMLSNFGEGLIVRDVEAVDEWLQRKPLLFRIHLPPSIFLCLLSQPRYHRRDRVFLFINYAM